MTDSISLNYWILGNRPTCTSIVSRSDNTILQFKERLIQKNGVELRDVDPDSLRLWSVDIEVGKLDQIKDEEHIKGTEVDVESTGVTLLSEVFLANSRPKRISIIVSHPYSSLSALRALREAVWNKPESLVSSKTVTYTMGDGELEKTCDVFDLREYAHKFQPLGFTLGPHLVVTKEYEDAFEFIGSQFSQEKPLHGFVVTGQPGIGKSLFLLYVLLRRMQEASPVALQCSTGYYLFDDKGVRLHGNSVINPLQTHGKIWCLSDSRDTTKVPAEAFFCSAAQIIQASSPQKDRWHSWAKESGGEIYVMDTWGEGELALLGSLRGEGEESVSEMLQLASEWGPSPRHLMRALDANVSHFWKDSMSRRIDEAADKLAADPLQVLHSVMALAHESTASPVLWVRPQNKGKNRAKFDTYVPDATKIAEAVRSALNRRSAVELAHYFKITYQNPHSRGLAGYLFESIMHTTITNGCQPFTWYTLDGSSEIVTSRQVISSRGQLQIAVTPFYFQPGLANYPGIDSALCTGKTIYAIQATVSSKHTSALVGLQKLYSELPVLLRLQKQNWCLVFAVPEKEQGRCLAESQREAIPVNSEWKNIKIGYFIPHHIQEFIAVVCSY